MAGHRDEVVVGGLRSDVDPVDGLHRVGVQQCPRSKIAHDPGHCGQGRDRADLVVHRDDGDHGRIAVVGPKRVLELGEIDNAPLVHSHQDSPGALDRIVHCVVLGLRGDRQRLRALEPQSAPDRHVVGLAASRGEHDLARSGTERGSDLLAGAVQRSAGLAGGLVGSGGVGVMLLGGSQPRLPGCRPQRRGRGVVQVDLVRLRRIGHLVILRGARSATRRPICARDRSPYPAPDLQRETDPLPGARPAAGDRSPTRRPTCSGRPIPYPAPDLRRGTDPLPGARPAAGDRSPTRQRQSIRARAAPTAWRRAPPSPMNRRCAARRRASPRP